ncbi:MAG TPA: Calx-beta domain-containing protein [Chitinophagales bacterium]|nr:Calx-beta domain-containing protein [Chitinophagales bacterium]
MKKNFSSPFPLFRHSSFIIVFITLIAIALILPACNDDDGNSNALTVSVNNASVTEGSTANISVTLSASSTNAVTVQYATVSGTAVSGTDFTSASGTLTFNPGQTSKTISVPTAMNGVANANKTFTLTLSNATNADIATGTATVTITDAPLPSGFYLFGTVDGQTWQVTQGMHGADGLYNDPANTNAVWGGGLWYSISTGNEYGSVNMCKNWPGGYCTTNQAYTMYATGTYGYSSGATQSEGASIMFRDASNKIWRSSSGSQTGSTFQITARGTTGNVYTTFEGNFSCKLYDSNGNSKTLTNGHFRCYGALAL